MSAEIDFTQNEIYELYHLLIQCYNNSLNQEALITKRKNVRGGSFVDWALGLTIVAAIIIVINNNVYTFQPIKPNLPPHLEWLYGNNYQHAIKNPDREFTDRLAD